MPHVLAPQVHKPITIGALVISGAIPILALAGTALTGGPLAASAVDALIDYSAVVVGFLGGVRWGGEIMRAPTAPNVSRLACAAASTVVAWAALSMPSQRPALGLLLLAAAIQLAWDVHAAHTGRLPAWTAPLRIAVAALAGIFLVAVIALAPASQVAAP